MPKISNVRTIQQSLSRSRQTAARSPDGVSGLSERLGGMDLKELEAVVRRAVQEEMRRGGEMSPPRVLTLKEAARQLSVSLSTLKGLLRTGFVRSTTVGERRMIPRSEIERLAVPDEPVKKGRGGPRRGQRTLPTSPGAAIRAAVRGR